MVTGKRSTVSRRLSEMPRSHGEGFELLHRQLGRLGDRLDSFHALQSSTTNEIERLAGEVRRLTREIGELAVESKAKAQTLDRALTVVEGRVRGLREKEADRTASERVLARHTTIPPPPMGSGSGGGEKEGT